MVLGSDGQARRLRLSISFLWLMGCLSLAALGALGLVAYLWVEAIKARDSASDRLEYLIRQSELDKYQKDLQAAPDQARRLLEELDTVARSADAGEATAGGRPPLAPLLASPEAEPKNPGLANGTANLTGSANLSNPVNGMANLTDPINGTANLTGPGAGSAVAAGLSQGNLSGYPAAGSDQALSGQTQASNPETEAWNDLWASWPPQPDDNDQLAVDDFKISLNGQFSFILKQAEEPGQRARGRSVAFFAVADARGQVKITPVPEFPAKDPKAGFAAGARYNIVSSKVVRGRVATPPGGAVLSVEIVAWDEDTRELVLRKRIRLGEL
jgi:hypothetical protein